MGIFDGVLLCTDFDGTLAVNAEVSPENAAADRVAVYCREHAIAAIVKDLEKTCEKRKIHPVGADNKRGCVKLIFDPYLN